jgi:hypothetical protein
MNARSPVHNWLLAVLAFGLIGTLVELLLLEHYEDGWQIVPLVLIACAVGGVAWHEVRPSGRTAVVLQAIMGLFVVAGLAGVAFHFQGAAEFQLEIDQSQPPWDVLVKAMRAKAPPVLAPGLMIQLGLIGLLYSSGSRE